MLMNRSTLAARCSPLIVLVFSAGCAGGSQVTKPKPAAIRSPKKPKPVLDESKRVSITAAQAKAKGLPAIDVSLIPASAFAVARFPQDATYLQLSGPPGGPLSLAIYAWPHGAKRDVGALKSWLQALINTDSTFGAAEKVSVGARPALAIAAVAGEKAARANHCAILVPAAGGKQTIVLAMIHGVGVMAKPSCEAAASHPQLAAVLASVRVP